MVSEYTCEMCGGVFEKVTSDEEQVAEFERLFQQPLVEDDVVIICHECWLAMGCDKIGVNEA